MKTMCQIWGGGALRTGGILSCFQPSPPIGNSKTSTNQFTSSQEHLLPTLVSFPLHFLTDPNQPVLEILYENQLSSPHSARTLVYPLFPATYKENTEELKYGRKPVAVVSNKNVTKME
ncbi:Hypothetical predicted protein [Podarcis lilfordi]|uniref:Uncharacterized protein n=1 Tax=Podarcis lilfordi TaxID=74358 RepID=A0AA35JWV0_9SAUR|nr:Hypothetical predicted protein [Podarcis lilfordi]